MGNSHTLLKTLNNTICRIVNVVSNMEQGPCFVIETHQITMSPNPPKSSKETRTARVSSSNINPTVSILIREEMSIRKTNFMPNIPQKQCRTVSSSSPQCDQVAAIAMLLWWSNDNVGRTLWQNNQIRNLNFSGACNLHI